MTDTDPVVAYYDLRTAPITFDFCHFIVAAFAYARTRGKTDFDLVIIASAYRNITERERSYTMVERQWRLWNLIVETVKVVPYIRNLTVAQRLPTTYSANCYPANYHPVSANTVPYAQKIVSQYFSIGADPRIFTPSAYAMAAATKLVPRTDKKIVSVTLRKASHDPSRDSKLDDWHAFIGVLNERGYQVVVIPDQDDALGDRTINKYGWNVLDVAAMSLDLRLAIYNLTDMNYVTNGGMVGLFMYSKVPFMWYSVIVEGHRMATPDYYKTHGVEYGQKFPWMGPNQEMMWEPDTLANLTASLDRI